MQTEMRNVFRSKSIESALILVPSFYEGKQAMESSDKNGPETVQHTNQAVLDASRTIQTLTEEVMILQRALSKVPECDRLKGTRRER
jgi:hypothetical protein